MYYAQQEEETKEKLSEKEFKFAIEYCKILSEHFKKCWFSESKVPNDHEEENPFCQFSMIASPPLENYKFFQVIEDVGEYIIENERIDLRKGDTVLLKYSSVIDLLKQNKVEMI
jgi:hypothetical protein